MGLNYAESNANSHPTWLTSKKGELLLLGQAEPTVVGIAPHLHHQ